MVSLIEDLIEKEKEYISNFSIFEGKNLNESISIITEIYQKNNLYKRLIYLFKAFIDFNYKSFNIYYNLANFYFHNKDYDLSIKTNLMALSIQNDSKAYINIATAYQRKKDYNNGIKYAKMGLKYFPKEVYFFRLVGDNYRKLQKIDLAIQFYKKLDYKQDCFLEHNLAHLYLINQDFKNAWKHNESRLCMYKNYFNKIIPKDKRYTNQSLQGKTILIHWEQGIGDIIQFARLIPLIQQKSPKKIIISVSKELIDLLQISFPFTKVVKENEKIKYDYGLFILSLAYIFNIDNKDIFMKKPYLKTNANININIDKSKLNIGIIWKSGISKLKTDKLRNCSLNHFKSIFKIQNTKIYSLQLGEWSKEIEKRNLTKIIINTSQTITTLNETASLINKLDLVISIGANIVHIAGALNKKCFVLLPNQASWRWGNQTNNSIWYPSLKLFRKREENRKIISYKKLIKDEVCKEVLALSNAITY
jgi:tetratricopeptide (TPR) repeat protein